MALQAILDDIDATAITLQGSCTHNMNQPAFATVRQRSNKTWGTTTSRLKLYVDGNLDFHGACSNIEDQGDETGMFTTLTFTDPTGIFDMRPARDPDGDFSKPSFIEDNGTAPQIIEAILTQSLDGSDPQLGEGPMGITLGTFETGGVSLAGAPTDFPMMISEVIALLVQTGELDVICNAIDSGGNMGEISAYNGNYGVDRTGSVSFEYATGSFNARGCRRTQDVTTVMNKNWIFGGPRVGTENDPPGNQHWKFNVTADDSGLPDPPLSTILAARSTSQDDYFVRMQIRIFDQNEGGSLRELARRFWLMESWLRLKPQTQCFITPNAGITPAFGIGDLISVKAGASFRGGFAGAQRVMSYTYTWDENGTVQLGEPLGMPGLTPVVTSSDAEGI